MLLSFLLDEKSRIRRSQRTKESRPTSSVPTHKADASPPCRPRPARPTRVKVGVPTLDRLSRHVMPARARALAGIYGCVILKTFLLLYKNPTLHIGVYLCRPFGTLPYASLCVIARLSLPRAKRGGSDPEILEHVIKAKELEKMLSMNPQEGMAIKHSFCGVFLLLC